MIGLVDLAFQQAKGDLPPPNLEIMKLAEYYRQEENKYCRLIPLDETEFSGYEIIYVFSEDDQCITVPNAFKRSSNVIYGGSAFTNKKYVPFKNEVIDYTLPKPNIYSNFLKEKYQAGITEKNINHILDDTYYRRFAGNNELLIPPIQKKKRVYIYDRDFFQPGWEEIIDDIAEHKPSSINFIHPAHFRRINDFLTARNKDIIAKGNDAYLDLNIPLQDTPILMKKYKNKILEVLRPSSQVFLSIGGSFQYRTEYYKDYVYKLNLLYMFWSHDIPLKLKYEEPTLGCYNPIADLSKHTAVWSRSPLKETKSILDRIPKDIRINQIRPEKEQAYLLIEKEPKAEMLLKQTLDTIKQGGSWIR